MRLREVIFEGLATNFATKLRTPWGDTNELVHEHVVGVFGFLQGLVGHRGLTGALPAGEFGDIVAQLAQSLPPTLRSATMPIRTSGRTSRRPDPSQAGSWLSLRICLSKTVVGA